MQPDDPWQAFQLKHQRGERLSAPIVDIVPETGLFVGLEGGIWGIVHLKDLDHHEPGPAAIERYAPDDVIQAVILSIDVELQRVSLGIKQLADPDFPDDPPAPVRPQPRGPEPPLERTAVAREETDDEGR